MAIRVTKMALRRMVRQEVRQHRQHRTMFVYGRLPGTAWDTHRCYTQRYKCFVMIRKNGVRYSVALGYQNLISLFYILFHFFFSIPFVRSFVFLFHVHIILLFIILMGGGG